MWPQPTAALRGPSRCCPGPRPQVAVVASPRGPPGNLWQDAVGRPCWRFELSRTGSEPKAWEDSSLGANLLTVTSSTAGILFPCLCAGAGPEGGQAPKPSNDPVSRWFNQIQHQLESHVTKVDR